VCSAPDFCNEKAQFGQPPICGAKILSFGAPVKTGKE
jgi:hypothetical protein